jgi:predicted nucleic acid-binding protein
MNIVLDTSVVISWFFNQTQTEGSLKFLNPKFEYLAPDLLQIEFDHFITKSIRKREIPPELGGRIHKQFFSMPIEYIPTADLRENAFFISNSLLITTFDAYFLSAALHRSCMFVTADQRLHNRIQESEYQPYCFLAS